MAPPEPRVLLFSGLDSPPETVAGRVIAMVLLVLGVGLAGLFTASVASLLIERYLRRRDVSCAISCHCRRYMSSRYPAAAPTTRVVS